jgi:hypothetical protein
LLELLQGKFSKNVMEIITRPEQGLFPNPNIRKMVTRTMLLTVIRQLHCRIMDPPVTRRLK